MERRGDRKSIEFYKMAAEIRNMEIKLFWQRSNYFLVLNTAIAVGFFSSISSGYSVILGIFGFIVSLIWIGVNLGSKFWQSRWEYRLQELEKEIEPSIRLFSASWSAVQDEVKKSFEFRQRGVIHRFYQRCVLLKPSVTLMMTFLSVVFAVFWILCIAAASVGK